MVYVLISIILESNTCYDSDLLKLISMHDFFGVFYGVCTHIDHSSGIKRML